MIFPAVMPSLGMRHYRDGAWPVDRFERAHPCTTGTHPKYPDGLLRPMRECTRTIRPRTTPRSDDRR